MITVIGWTINWWLVGIVLSYLTDKLATGNTIKWDEDSVKWMCGVGLLGPLLIFVFLKYGYRRLKRAYNFSKYSPWKYVARKLNQLEGI